MIGLKFAVLIAAAVFIKVSYANCCWNKTLNCHKRQTKNLNRFRLFNPQYSSGEKDIKLTPRRIFFSENHDQNCPPEWSLVHQCWKSFEMHYKQFGNDTALNVRQKEVQTMCSCMADAVNQVTTNDIVEITA